MGTVQALIQLVELHQDAGIPYIQFKRPFEQNHCFLLFIQFVEIGQ